VAEVIGVSLTYMLTVDIFDSRKRMRTDFFVRALDV
jgi:hypothetical protein